ncbi:MAG: HypC/HybG/HupF family hydrogenase formation chaperone [Candidatus Methanomethylicaceae archaeon]
MCLAVPARVVKIEGELAEVDIGGIRREASLALVADRGIAVGDYVLVHTGYAITKVDEEEAMSILDAWKQVMAAEKEIQL